ncbi:MAG: AraC family transcriptional regulator [Limnochordia bacterium]
MSSSPCDYLSQHFSVRVWWVKRWCLPAGWRWEGPRRRPFTTVWYVLDGALAAQQEDRHFRLGPEHLIVIPPGAQTFSWNDADRELRYLSLGCELLLDEVDLFASREPVVVQQRLPESLVSLWVEMEPVFEQYLASKDPFDFLELTGLTQAWWARLWRLLRIDLSLGSSIHPCLSQALRWMRENMHRRISLREVACQVHLSPGYLRDLFRSELDTNYTATLRRMRMTQAKALLLDSSYSVSQVARYVGYSDVHHFSRAFTRYESLTPSAFREANRRGI